MAFAEAFEALFLIADADRDGYISGGEAINFFRSADLPQPTLAKMWEFANKDQTGFLSRKEFFDALKLATVAQMGRELTPELVKAALTGPAAAQIPPPRMTLRPPSASLEETGAPPQNSQPTPMQANYGQHFSSPQSGTAPDHFGLQGSARRVPSNASLSTANASLNASDSASNEPRAVNPPNFQGGTQLTRLVDAGPLKTSASREPHGLGEFSRPNSSIGDMATNCSPRPLSAGPTGSLGLTQAPPSVNVTSNPGTWGYDGRQLGAAASPHWPKMTPSDMQRFVQVFSQMDTDHDGKITGEQARQLFLSWQLPREVLRHVWNLSDEDGDSMLSIREFCTAVYLLEKFTEGWPLPSRLPTGIHLDETPTSAKNVFAPESVLGSGGSNWRPPQGSVPPTDFVLEPGPEFGALSTSSARHVQNPLSTGDVSLERANCVPQNSQTSHTKSHFIKQNREPERTLTPTPAEPIKIVPTQVAGLNRHGMSQKEKAEYYRSKLQEITGALQKPV
ncbi:hypothetical protein KC19_1G013500 [Ceratodon purpureus]|uniref:Uncharacterized protein n=1 Tax=Ceratodon purpureus TaxID=3225 RepID=A0A8T0J2Z3_CERPU|nr:hypothetical protein KC19_1G013500 [Ceratodon purpureus]